MRYTMNTMEFWEYKPENYLKQSILFKQLEKDYLENTSINNKEKERQRKYSHRKCDLCVHVFMVCANKSIGIVHNMFELGVEI